MRDIAMFLPLTVILDILGLPEQDYEKMLVLTQQLFGAQDEDMQRGSDPLNVMEVIADFLHISQNSQRIVALIQQMTWHPSWQTRSLMASHSQ